MSVFGKLREMVGWVLGEDLSAPDEPSQPRQQRAAPAKKAQRRSEGDGFDDVRPAPRATTSPPRLEVSAPLDAPGSFVASLDDLHDLSGGQVEPEPEFIPEGGMSTQSLMREFETLDPELQAAAIEQAARSAAEAEAAGPAERSTQALISEVDALSGPAALPMEVGTTRAAPADAGASETSLAPHVFASMSEAQHAAPDSATRETSAPSVTSDAPLVVAESAMREMVAPIVTSEAPLVAATESATRETIAPSAMSEAPLVVVAESAMRETVAPSVTSHAPLVAAMESATRETVAPSVTSHAPLVTAPESATREMVAPTATSETPLVAESAMREMVALSMTSEAPLVVAKPAMRETVARSVPSEAPLVAAPESATREAIAPSAMSDAPLVVAESAMRETVAPSVPPQVLGSATSAPSEVGPRVATPESTTHGTDASSTAVETNRQSDASAPQPERID